MLERSVGAGDTILVSGAQTTGEPEELLEVFNDSIQQGLEGIVAKRPDSPYQAGTRNYNWVKLKRVQAGNLQDTVDCVVVGYIYGQGRRAAFGVGALVVAAYSAPAQPLTAQKVTAYHRRQQPSADLVPHLCSPSLSPEAPLQ